MTVRKDIRDVKSFRFSVTFGKNDIETLHELMEEDGETIASAYIRRLIHEERKRRGRGAAVKK